MNSGYRFYEIVMADGGGEFYGTRSGNWSPSADERFATEEEALAAIDDLRAMREWADVILAVQPSDSRWVWCIVHPRPRRAG